MKNLVIQKCVQGILDKANVTINGSKAYDIKLLDERALKAILKQGSLGLGESYMAGWWECERLDELSFHLCRAGLDTAIKPSFLQLLYNLSTKIINYQSRKRAPLVALKHYNLDNKMFELMLGQSMAYSCGYWKNATNLNEAQQAKFDLVCRKLYLTQQDTLLDVGCGWGGLAAYAAEHYGCQVVGINISENQISYANEKYKHLPIEFHLADYRDQRIYNPKQKQFSKIVSVGAFEHIGYKNHQNFLQLLREQLSPEGLFLLHTIGNNRTVTTLDPWINKYIFPNGILPSMLQLSQAIENCFIVEDWHNFGAYYDKTLLAWYQNFEDNWLSLKERFDTQFYRMWRFYLLMCAGMFRSRTGQLWQITMSKSGLLGGYESVR
ncbi:Cyclopropane-fatty-acyl-phospholipid synthase [Legionella massiliensis]|uniref:Cyclopropane-fatty-acyl-phospholipid synthase n=1 Tax=Legionella massiliensis TaxID=1034943 RepID=A0A078KWS5_9GAMM|nr:cyclopropane fatty acyl phospholipid synthase [Legionella massiliensis]CDZ77432.1 Cyclopropane-fatty-acyl-phospholipid synthase [Legionella massiliensis]CEE13170.1 Cyclopropane-fatty-acyl-phospholipid synthase [Legionella massiliensis]